MHIHQRFPSLLPSNPNNSSAERILKKNASEPVIYRFDKVESIKMLDREEMTYTMSVDDPLHQFVADGVIHKNSAAHCMLWTLIQFQKWLDKHNMKTCIIGTIHDSLIADVHPKEEQDVLNKLYDLITNSIMKKWKWITIPFETEVELSEPDGNWYEKKKWENVKGTWREAKE